MNRNIARANLAHNLESNVTAVKTIELDDDIVIRIFHDQTALPPNETTDFLGSIAYMRESEYTLGTEAASRARMQEIEKGIADGSIIGMPVYAYVHGGVCLSTKPFTCPWDSGQSGLVYATRERVEAEGLDDAMVLVVLRDEVEQYSRFLEGEVYCFEVTRLGKVLDLCWEIYGLDDAVAQARESAADAAAALKREQETLDAIEEVEGGESAYWAARDVATV